MKSNNVGKYLTILSTKICFVAKSSPLLSTGHHTDPIHTKKSIVVNYISKVLFIRVQIRTNVLLTTEVASTAVRTQMAATGATVSQATGFTQIAAIVLVRQSVLSL